MTTPGKPITGGPALRIPALTSPNFNLANPTASPNPSWGLLQSGILYAFGLVLSGGTITGPDYIINSSGIFIYSGTPANGNLIGSWAGVAGTDGFGNAYPQGFNITQGAISGTVFSGTNFVLNTSGLFLYNGTPGLGTLIVALTPIATNDAFGNTFEPGLTVGRWNGAGVPLNNVTSSVRTTGAHGFLVSSSSGVFVANIDPTTGALLVYNSSGLGLGNLVASVAPAAGTDSAGNAYKKDITVYGTSSSTAQLLAGSSIAQLLMGTGDAAETSTAVFSSKVAGAGATRQLEALLRGPSTSTPGTDGVITFDIASGSVDQTSAQPFLDMIATSNNGGAILDIFLDPNTFAVGALITATTAQTAFTNNIIDKNSNQVLAVQADTTTFTRTNPTGTAVDITKSWSIPANDAQAGTTYCIEVPFTGVWEASGNFNLEFDLNGTHTNLVPVASSLATAGHNYGGVYRLFLQVRTTGAGGTCDIWGDGGATDTSVARAGATSADLFGINTAHAFNTTTSNTLAVSAVFSVSNASQTVVTRGSTFARMGA